MQRCEYSQAAMLAAIEVALSPTKLFLGVDSLNPNRRDVALILQCFSVSIPRPWDRSSDCTSISSQRLCLDEILSPSSKKAYSVTKNRCTSTAACVLPPWRVGIFATMYGRDAVETSAFYRHLPPLTSRTG